MPILIRLRRVSDSDLGIASLVGSCGLPLLSPGLIAGLDLRISSMLPILYYRRIHYSQSKELSERLSPLKIIQ